MTKQRLERDVADVLKLEPRLWFQKFYHIAGKYTEVPADYIVLSDMFRYLLECKECKRKVLSIDRLTQLSALMDFINKSGLNQSFFIIGFWLGSKKSSVYYMIPAFIMRNTLITWHKKSFNMTDMATLFSQYSLALNDIPSKLV